MKKNNSKKLTKVSAVLVTALMAASAAGMTTSASEMKQAEALNGGRAVKSSTRNTRKAKGGAKDKLELDENTALHAEISLVGTNAKPGDIIEVPVIMNTGNTCTCYDVLVEFDSRLEFQEVTGVQASADFEEGGRKFVSLVGYTVEPYQDGEAIATIKLRVPDNAENDDYEVKFSQITSFSTNVADYENYTTNNAIITVTGGVEKRGVDTIKLMSTTGMAGDSAVVQLVPSSGNKCVAYDLLVEYDSRLLLEDKDVAGANAHCIFEEGGKSYVSLVGYTSGVFADGDAMAALNFHLPQDATESDVYEVNITTVTDFSSSYATFENYETQNAVISVCESSRPNDKFKEFKMFKRYAANGDLIGSAVGYRGDANNDGKADVRDAAGVANFCATKSGIDDMGQYFGDVDDSGRMDVRDAAKIARYVAMGRTSWDSINGK